MVRLEESSAELKLEKSKSGFQLALLNLHLAKTPAALDCILEQQLGQLLSGHPWAYLFEEGDSTRVRMTSGANCPLVLGQEHADGSWPVNGLRSLPLLYEGFVLGRILLHGTPTALVIENLENLILHYSTALAERHLEQDLDSQARSRGLLLEAFEETVYLLQETDKEAIQARFLEICTDLLDSSAAALYVHEDLGHEDSPLRLAQSWGIGERDLDGLRLDDGSWWPQTLVGDNIITLERDRILGLVPGLKAETYPEAMVNLVAGPLRYDDVAVGVILLFNLIPEKEAYLENLKLLEGLLKLGAAAIHRKELEEQAMRGRVLTRELEIAGTLQEKLRPRGKPASKLLDWAWHGECGFRIGGDYLDLVEGTNNDVHGIVADVSGAGINSALMMTSFRATWLATVKDHDPSVFLNHLNEKVCEEVEGTAMFLTAASFHLSASGRYLAFTSAGHPPALFFSRSENRILKLEASAPPLGFQNHTEYLTRHLETRPGDAMLIYSDGLTESMNEQEDEMFGMERVETIFRSCVDMGAETIVEAIVRELDRFSPPDLRDDDVSISVLKIR